MTLPGTTGSERTFQKQSLRFAALEANMPVAGVAVAGAAALNQAQGIVTSEALVTVAGATYTLVLTNSLIGATDIVMAEVLNGTNAAGTPAMCTATPAAGSVTFVIQNIHAANAFNGTLKIGFMTVKPAPAQL